VEDLQLLRESVETHANLGQFDTDSRMFTCLPSGTQTELYLSAAHLIDLRHWGSK